MIGAFDWDTEKDCCIECEDKKQGDNMNLENVKAGDKVRIIDGTNKPSMVREVERVTKTQVVFLNSDGSKVPGSCALKLNRKNGQQIGDWTVPCFAVSVVPSVDLEVEDFQEVVEAPIADKTELIQVTLNDLEDIKKATTKKLQDTEGLLDYYRRRLAELDGKPPKTPEQEQAERALIKRFADYLTVERVTATTLARFIFVNEPQDSIEEVITMVVPDVIDKENGSLHEGICDLIKAYPEAEISIRSWNQEDI